MDSFKFLSKNFLGISISGLLYFGSFYLLLPILPIYVENLGGATHEIGLVIGIFTVSSVILRPYFGKLTDIYGLRKFLLIGTALFALPYITYIFIDSTTILMPVRFFHGLTYGIYLTAVYAYVANLAPENRRGEVIGVFSLISTTGMAIFPALSTFIISTTNNFTILFLLGSAMVIVAFIAVYIIDEQQITSEETAPVSIMAVLTRKPVIISSLTLCTMAATYGTIFTFLPVYAPSKGIYDISLFFIVYSVFTLSSRIFAGKMSDKYGRYKVILPFMVLNMMSLLLLTVMNSTIIMLAVAALFGLGFGGFIPALNAYLVDETRREERASSLAVFSSFIDIGIAFGAILFGFIAHLKDYPTMFIAAAIFIVFGFILFAVGARKSSSPSNIDC